MSKNGILVTKSKNVEEREKFKEAIETQHTKNYEVKLPKEVCMQIMITDMNFRSHRCLVGNVLTY